MDETGYQVTVGLTGDPPPRALLYSETIGGSLASDDINPAPALQNQLWVHHSGTDITERIVPNEQPVELVADGLNCRWLEGNPRPPA